MTIPVTDPAANILAQAFREQLSGNMHDDATALEALSSVIREKPGGQELGDLLQRIGLRVRRYALALDPNSTPAESVESILNAAGGGKS